TMRFRPAPVPSPTCTAITAVRRAVAIAFRSFEIWSKGRSASSRSPVPPSRLPEASIFPALGGRRLPRRRLHQIGGDLAEPVTFRRKAPHLQAHPPRHVCPVTGASPDRFLKMRDLAGVEVKDGIDLLLLRARLQQVDETNLERDGGRIEPRRGRLERLPQERVENAPPLLGDRIAGGVPGATVAFRLQQPPFAQILDVDGDHVGGWLPGSPDDVLHQRDDLGPEGR